MFCVWIRMLITLICSVWKGHSTLYTKKTLLVVFHHSHNLQGIERALRGTKHSTSHRGGFQQHVIHGAVMWGKDGESGAPALCVDVSPC